MLEPYLSVSTGHTVKSDTSSFVLVSNPGSDISTHNVNGVSFRTKKTVCHPCSQQTRQKALSNMEMCFRRSKKGWTDENSKHEIIEQDKPPSASNRKTELPSSTVPQSYSKENIINFSFEAELYFENIEGAFLLGGKMNPCDYQY